MITHISRAKDFLEEKMTNDISSAISEGKHVGYHIIVTDDIKHRYAKISKDEYPILMAEYAQKTLNQLDDLGKQLDFIDRRIDTIDKRVDAQNNRVGTIRQWVAFFGILTILSIIAYIIIFFSTLGNTY